MVSWTHGDNHDGAPPHSCLGLRHDKIDTTIFWGASEAGTGHLGSGSKRTVSSALWTRDSLAVPGRLHPVGDIPGGIYATCTHVGMGATMRIERAPSGKLLQIEMRLEGEGEKTD